jgi:hypothetical protein
MGIHPDRPPLRRYRGHFADSERWQRFATRADDVIITTPSKCGTTWMQTIVGMLLLGRVELGAPISTISPWLDMQIHSDDEVFGILDRQTQRRFIKSHTPLDGLPLRSTMTYIAVVRHPLDVALSDRDHGRNMRADVAMELRNGAVGEPDPDPVVRTRAPEDPGDFLRWFIDNDEPPSGSGPHGLCDYCQQVLTYWDAREAPNVHLVHYADLWADLDGQMRRVADVLGVAVDEARWPAFVEGATLSSMRARAADTAPNAHQGLWESPEKFFRAGGTRAWASLLTAADITHFEHRMHELAGDAAAWALEGQALS